MSDPKDKSKLLYDAVSKDYALGTYEEFVEKLKDSTKRRAFYDGVGKDYALGSYDEFEGKLEGLFKKKNVSISQDPELASEQKMEVGSLDLPQVPIKDERADALKTTSSTDVGVKVFDKQPIKPKETTEKSNYGGELYRAAKRGSTRLGKDIASVPEFLYDIFAVPQNAIADPANWPYGLGYKLNEVFDLGSLATDSEKFKKDVGVKNVLKEHYAEMLEKQHLKQQELDTKYEGGIVENFQKGNIADGFRLLGISIIESMPVSLAIAMSGGAASAPEILLGTTVVFGSGRNEELKQDGEGMTQNERVVNAIGNGFAEGIFETLGTSRFGAAAKELLLKEGKDEGAKILKANLIDMYTSLLKKYPIPSGMIGEGVEEAATQITQNALNGRPLGEGVPDAFLVGMGSGGVFGTSIEGIKKLTKEKVSPKDIETVESVKEKEELVKNELTQQVKDGDLKPSEAKDIYDNWEEVKENLKAVPDEFTPEQKAKAVKLLREKKVLEKAIEGKDPNLVEDKKAQLDEVNNQLKNINAKSEETAVETKEPEVETTTPETEEINQNLEVKKADIEKRRQEELNEYKDKDASKVEEFTFTNEEGDITYVQIRTYPNGKRMAYQNIEKNKYGNVNDSSPFEISKEQSTEDYLKAAYHENTLGKYKKTGERTGEEANLNAYSKKINAKYDAELDALNKVDIKKGELTDNTYTTKEGENFDIDIVDGKNGKVGSFEDRKRKYRFNLAVRDQSGKMIGDVGFWQKEDGSWYANYVNVEEEHRRKGIANAMYDFAEKQGMKIVPSDEQTDSGKAFSESRNKQKTNDTKTAEDTVTNGDLGPTVEPSVEKGEVKDVQPTVKPTGVKGETEIKLGNTDKATTYKVSKTKEGQLQVVDDKGKPVEDRYTDKKGKVKKGRKNDVLYAYADTVDLTEGQKFEVPKDATPEQAFNIDTEIANNSKNPAELAELALRTATKNYIEQNIDPAEVTILEYVTGNIKRGTEGTIGNDGSFINQDDASSIGNSIAKTYLRKNGRGLDVLAQELSDVDMVGREVTEQEIIDLMKAYPNGVNDIYKAVRDITSNPAKSNFTAITGLPASDRFLQKAIDQQIAKEKLNKELDNNYLMQLTDEELISLSKDLDDYENFRRENPKIDTRDASEPSLKNTTGREQQPRVQKTPSKQEKRQVKSVKDLEAVGKELFGLNDQQAKASAVVTDCMVETMAKREGISKDEMYAKLEFRKGDSQTVEALKGKALFQIIGENAELKEEFKSRLEVAKELESNSKTPKKIWFATGWEKGVDGKWRMELDDSKMKLKEDFEVMRNYNLEDAIDYPELFEAYPELGKVKISVIPRLGNMLGAYIPNKNLIMLNRERSLDELRSTLLHEIQHIVQGQEGFATGGTPKMAQDYVKSKIMAITLTKNLPKPLVNIAKKLSKSLFNGININANKKQLVTEINRYKNKLSQDQLDLYRSIAGEVESRNVQSRAQLTPLQRKMTPLSSTEDIGREEQLILFQEDQGAMLAEDGKFIVYALTDPNVSTPLHEMAHVYEHYLKDAERKDILDWAGHKEWTTETSEKFARGFENYLATGKAPNAKLKALFESFKQWLTEIYNGIKNSAIDVKLSPKMEAIYAEMLGKTIKTEPQSKAKNVSFTFLGEEKTGVVQDDGKIKGDDGTIYTEKQVKGLTEIGQGRKKSLTKERIKPLKRKAKNAPKKLNAIIGDVANNLKATLIYGKSVRRGMAGTYSPGNTLVKIRNAGDIDTVAHELGHLLDDRHDLLGPVTGHPNEILLVKQLKWFADRGGSNPPSRLSKAKKAEYLEREGLAEFIRAYVVNPDMAKQVSPELYDHFENTIDAKTKEVLQQFSDDVLDFENASYIDKTKSNVETSTLPDKKGFLEWLDGFKSKDGKFNINFWDKFKTNWTNSMHLPNKAFKFIQGIKGTDIKKLMPEENFEVMSRLFAGINGKFNYVFSKGMINGKEQLVKDSEGKRMTIKYLIEGLDNTSEQTLRDDMADVMVYMISERTIEYAKKLGRFNDLTGIGGGLESDLGVAVGAMAEFEQMKNDNPERYERIKDGARRYREYADAGLRYMVEKGRISEAQYQRIKDTNEYYVSLARTKEIEPGEELLPFLNESNKISSVKEPIKKIKGGTDTIKNPYMSLINNTVNIIKESDRNEIMLSFVKPLTEARGMGDGTPVDLAQIGRQVPSGDKNTIKVYKDGDLQYWQFDQDIYEGLKGLESVAHNPIIKALGKPADLIRFTVTNFPVFAARNAFRDTMSRLVISRTRGKVSDLWHNHKDRELFELYGGSQAGFYLTNESAYKDQMNKAVKEMTKKGGIILDPRKLNYKTYRKLLERGENLNRVAEFKSAYRKAIKEGMDERNAGLYAAYQARDLMDFAVAGHYMRVINKLVPFSNASLQSVKRSIKGAKESPAKFALRMALFTVLPQIALRALVSASGDDDEYEQLPDYQRDLFWNFKTPLTGDAWISFPKPFELGLPSSMIDRGISKAKGNDDAFDGSLATSIKTLFPFDEAALIGSVKPIIEASANHDFFRDRDIVPFWEKDKTMDLREGTKYASRIGQGLSKGFGFVGLELDPRKIDHVIKGYTTYYGDFALSLGDIGKEDSRNQFNFTKTGFAKDIPISNAKSVKKAYDLAKDIGADSDKNVKMLKGMVKLYYDLEDKEAKKKLSKAIYKTTKEFVIPYLEAKKTIKLLTTDN